MRNDAMPRPLSIALLAILFLAKPSLADEKAKPSPAVKKILDEAVGDVKKNRQAFDKANEKPIAEARDKLQELAKKLIEEGKTDEVTAVLGQVKTLEADVMKMANASNGGGKAVLQKSLLDRLAGRWNRSNDQSYWVIERDGTAGCRNLQSHKPCHQDSKVRVIDEETGEIAWPNGWRWQIRMAGNDVLAIHETGPDGKVFADGLILTRQR
jgi:hypothetical protein